MKKNILVGIGIIVILIVGVLTFWIVSDFKQEDKLKVEIQEICEMIDSEEIDLEAIEKRRDSVITTGDYEIVEKAVKNYLLDIAENNKKVIEILRDDTIAKLLTAENYKEDGPEFIQTKSYISETKAKLEVYKERYSELFSEEKIMSYISKEDIDSYYTDFYRKEMIGEIENKETVENSLKELIQLLEDSRTVINFLIENNGTWEVVGNKILFETDELVDEYNRLTAKF